MRKSILEVLTSLALLLPAVACADEYVLVMSKEDNVCQYMLGLYNEDLKKYGEVRYNEHEEFTVIKWEEKKYYMLREGKKKYPSYSDNTVIMSIFDINNDGKDEIVVKDTTPVGDRPSEILYFLKIEDSGYFNEDEFDVNILYTKAAGSVGTGADGAFKANVYSLKELPPYGIDIEPYKGRLRYYSLGGWFIVNPFVLGKAGYISMLDDDAIENKKFLVILKYHPDNQLKDTCYYLKVFDSKKPNQ